MFQVGIMVRVLAPFDAGLEDAVFTVVAVQFVADDGTISEQPTDQVQYLISGDGVEMVAFAAHNLEPIS